MGIIEHNDLKSDRDISTADPFRIVTEDSSDVRLGGNPSILSFWLEGRGEHGYLSTDDQVIEVIIKYSTVSRKHANAERIFPN